MKTVLSATFLSTTFLSGLVLGQFSGARPTTQKPRSGDTVEVYRPAAHDLYDGKFNIEGKKIYQVGGIYDAAPWDHMGKDGKNVQAVGGNVEISVNEIENTGRFGARLRLPEGWLELVMERFYEFTPCQDGGIAREVKILMRLPDGRNVATPAPRHREAPCPRRRALVERQCRER